MLEFPFMRSIEAKILGVAVAAGIIAGGCSARQIENLKLVDCSSGSPTTGETSLTRPNGSIIYVGGYDGFGGNVLREPMAIIFKDNGAIRIPYIDDTTSHDRIALEISPDQSTAIKAGGITVNPDRSFVFNSNNIDFTITPKNNKGLTELNIKEVCVR